MPFPEFKLNITNNNTPINEYSAIIVPVWQTHDSEPRLFQSETIKKIIETVGSRFTERMELEGFSGAAIKTFSYQLESGTYILLAGIGKENARPYRIRKAIDNAIKTLKAKSFDSILFQFDDITINPQTAATLAALCASQKTYRSVQTRTPGPSINKIEINSKGLTDKHLNVAKEIARSRALAMDLVNTPPNLKNTQLLADTARSLPGSITVTVLEDIRKIEQEMPCFFTVARGSLQSDPPKFVHMKYTAKNEKMKIALVGKGVIFDTGGYQVKPGEFMNTMKADMTGAASVIGAMQSIAELQPEHITVNAYTALTPNMIDANAMVPDSIVDTTCGKKVEIRHTDAEGRLTLIDAVTVAAREQPEQIITVATLTGSAGRAVGTAIALMTRPLALSESFGASGEAAGDPVQTLEVLEEDFEDIKSKLDAADINNTGNRKYRGAQTAAAFVMSGAEDDQQMIHLDIAGGDMSDDDKATGIAVPALVQYILDLDSRNKQ